VGVESGEGETVIAFACARRGLHETRDAFAGGKWPENGRFVRAKVSVVSTVCGKELAEVSSVSGEVVGGCCETAVAPISAKNSPSRSGFWNKLRKVRPAGEKALILGSFGGAGRTLSRVDADGGEQGEFFRACGVGLGLG